MFFKLSRMVRRFSVPIHLPVHVPIRDVSRFTSNHPDVRCFNDLDFSSTENDVSRRAKRIALYQKAQRCTLNCQTLFSCRSSVHRWDAGSTLWERRNRQPRTDLRRRIIYSKPSSVSVRLPLLFFGSLARLVLEIERRARKENSKSCTDRSSVQFFVLRER